MINLLENHYFRSLLHIFCGSHNNLECLFTAYLVSKKLSQGGRILLRVEVLDF
jgi:hypothetical protein